jgi:hypothetical protein
LLPHNHPAAAAGAIAVLRSPLCCLSRCSPAQALDYVLHEASQRGMRVILSLSDFYGAFGMGQAGFEPYLQVRRCSAIAACCAA